LRPEFLHLLLLSELYQRFLLLPLRCVQLYERIVKGNGFAYFVNGAGGQNLSSFSSELEQGAKAFGGLWWYRWQQITLRLVGLAKL
jgi:hypothetical protein